MYSTCYDYVSLISGEKLLFIIQCNFISSSIWMYLFRWEYFIFKGNVMKFIQRLSHKFILIRIDSCVLHTLCTSCCNMCIHFSNKMREKLVQAYLHLYGFDYDDILTSKNKIKIKSEMWEIGICQSANINILIIIVRCIFVRIIFPAVFVHIIFL